LKKISNENFYLINFKNKKIYVFMFKERQIQEEEEEATKRAYIMNKI
jgi:hypothetical protein